MYISIHIYLPNHCKTTDSNQNGYCQKPLLLAEWHSTRRYPSFCNLESEIVHMLPHTHIPCNLVKTHQKRKHKTIFNICTISCQSHYLMTVIQTFHKNEKCIKTWLLPIYLPFTAANIILQFMQSSTVTVFAWSSTYMQVFLQF